MAIGTERIPARLVAHLRTALEVGRAMIDLHRIHIYHVDLNPMNVLYRSEHGRPVIRIVDFESSVRARPAFGWRLLQSADDPRLLSAGGRPSGAGCAF